MEFKQLRIQDYQGIQGVTAEEYQRSQLLVNDKGQVLRVHRDKGTGKYSLDRVYKGPDGKWWCRDDEDEDSECELDVVELACLIAPLKFYRAPKKPKEG